MNANTLAWWKWRLGSDGERVDGPARSDARVLRAVGGRASSEVAVRGDAAPVSFVELAGLVGTAEKSADEGGLQLVCGGIRVNVPAGFDAPTLARVLDVLEGRS